MTLPKKRLFGFAIVVLLFFGLFLYRLFSLQVIRGEQYEKFSRANSLRQIRIPAPRGQVLDRNGQLLIENRPSFVVSVNLAQVEDLQKGIETLAYLLGRQEEELLKIIEKRKELPRFNLIVVERGIDRDRVAQIRGKISRISTEVEEDRYDLNGINLELRFERVYPEGEEFGHLLGYVREGNEKDIKHWEEKEPGRVGLGDQVGVVGVEKAFDPILRGYDGFRRAFVDARGNEVDLTELGLEEFLQDSPTQAGKKIWLTIDSELTKTAYEAFGKKVGSLVAINPKNGEILAMVSLPSYHSSQLSGVIPYATWNRMRDHPDNILLNRSIQAAYPPGSTYKIVTAVAALATGKINFSEKIRCNGHITLGGRKWHCWNRGGHGPLNLTQALIHSCDVFFYQLGTRLGPDKLAHYARLLGLGKETEVLKDWERSGLIPTSAWKLKYRKEEWKNSDNLGNAIGQGYNLVTPIQSALMVSQFANGGKKITPHLILGTENSEGNRQPQLFPEARSIAWSLKEKDFERLKKGLVEVVQGAGGTGGRAKVPGIEVAGKTGTAQVVGLERKGRGKRGVKTEDHAWFVAFAPAKDPEIALAVVVEHGGSGGAVAAPIAQKVLSEFFKGKKR